MARICEAPYPERRKLQRKRAKEFYIRILLMIICGVKLKPCEAYLEPCVLLNILVPGPSIFRISE